MQNRREMLTRSAKVAAMLAAVGVMPGLARAQCPVLVMAGELDPVCPVEDSRDIAATRHQRKGDGKKLENVFHVV